jgi:hypothetical protein
VAACAQRMGRHGQSVVAATAGDEAPVVAERPVQSDA